MVNKNKKSNMTRPEKNQTSTGSAKTKRRRAKLKPGAPTMGVVPLPSIYRRSGDEFSIRLRTTTNLVNGASGFAAFIIALTPTTIGTTGYAGLADFLPLLVGIGQQYSRFMVTRVVAQLVPTTAVTSGGYVALGYQADDTGVSGPPATLSDVTSALHSDVAQVTEIAGIEFNASDYFNDWRQCSTPASSYSGQAGVLQLWSTNSSALGSGVGLVQIEVDMHFSGFRKL